MLNHYLKEALGHLAMTLLCLLAGAAYTAMLYIGLHDNPHMPLVGISLYTGFVLIAICTPILAMVWLALIYVHRAYTDVATYLYMQRGGWDRAPVFQCTVPMYEYDPLTQHAVR